MTGKGLSLHDLAGQEGTVQAIGLALDEGADPDELSGDRRETPLHVAARNDNVPAAHILVMRGANAEIRDRDQCSPFSVAIYSRASFEMVATLGSVTFIMPYHLHAVTSYACDREVISYVFGFCGSEYGVHPDVRPDVRNRNGNSPLHLYAQVGKDPAVIGDLVRYGCDPNARNVRGFTPLHSAKERNPNPAIFQALLAAGSFPHLRDFEAGQTASEVQFLPPNVRRVQFL